MPTRCVCDGCSEPAATFKHFPAVVGYCHTHGGVLADFLSTIDAPGVVGFDSARLRWERRARRLGVLG